MQIEIQFLTPRFKSVRGAFQRTQANSFRYDKAETTTNGRTILTIEAPFNN